MIKLVIIGHKKPGMNSDEFRNYWCETHGPITSKMPGLQKYVLNFSVIPPDGTMPPCDGFAELWFDDFQALQQAFASPEGQAAAADAENFADSERTETFVVEQVDIK